MQPNDDAEWHRVLDVNVVGIARVSRAALPHLRRSAHAVDRQHVLGGGLRRAAGSARSTRPARARCSRSPWPWPPTTSREGIRVNAVAPGTADTPWVGRLLDAAEDPAAAAEALRARQPMGRLVTAEEVAAAVAALVSPSVGSITASVLRVDGGMTSLRI